MSGERLLAALRHPAGLCRQQGARQCGLRACQADSIVSLIGPNGAGKTSLFNCITGFYKPQAGEIRLRRARASQAQAAPGDRSRHRPYLPERAAVPRDDGARERNVRHALPHPLRRRSPPSLRPARAARRKSGRSADFAEECLRFVGVEDGWDREATTLAYGHQRRVEIARALATRPKLILLDEPAAGLNSGEKQELIR